MLHTGLGVLGPAAREGEHDGIRGGQTVHAGGHGGPPMMQEMMQKMMGGMKDFNPMAMCQAMVTSVATSAEMAAYATPEVRGLCEEWATKVEEEMLAALKTRGEADLDQLAADLKLGPDSALYFLGKLVRAGHVSISGVSAAHGKTSGKRKPSRK